MVSADDVVRRRVERRRRPRRPRRGRPRARSSARRRSTATRVLIARSAGRGADGRGRSRGPRPVTISCSMVPAHVGPVGDGRLAVVTRSEDGDASRRSAPGVAEVDDGHVHREPADQRPALARAPAPRRGRTRPAAARRRTRAAPARGGPGRGGPGVAVADRRSRPATRRTSTRGAVSVSAGRRWSCGTGRCRPARRRPGSSCGGSTGRSASRRWPPGGGREGAARSAARRSSAPGERAAGRARCSGRPGRRRGQVTHHADDPDPAAAARPAGPRGTGPPTRRARPRRGPCRCRGGGARAPRRPGG